MAARNSERADSRTSSARVHNPSSHWISQRRVQRQIVKNFKQIALKQTQRQGMGNRKREHIPLHTHPLTWEERRPSWGQLGGFCGLHVTEPGSRGTIEEATSIIQARDDKGLNQEREENDLVSNYNLRHKFLLYIPSCQTMW